MPANRRSTRPAARGAQPTLSFSGKNNKVTKSSAAIPQHPKKKDPSLLADLKASDAELPTSDEEGKLTTAEQAVQKQGKVEVEKVARTAEQEQAEKISEAQLKRYWQAREAERKAPRVHQQDLGIHEKILRHFDLSSQFGPCIGTARMKRWNRAHSLNLHPPIEVLSVLLKEESKGNSKVERAYVDELMTGRYVVD
ncbi:MAG: hypothetical protein M1833_000923 [Piccolia ochrophora]|nr:MAG: hypothetical protein M1833_000923 [Piccolia ochrophora]